jgi:hypothetical protein
MRIERSEDPTPGISVIEIGRGAAGEAMGVEGAETLEGVASMPTSRSAAFTKSTSGERSLWRRS